MTAPAHTSAAGKLNPDTMQYFVLCRFKAGLEWVARDPANMSRRDTIADICSGELPDVVTVLECNPVEKICNDVTEDILAECLKANFIALGEKFFADEIAPLTGQDRIDWERDHERAMKEHV